MISIVEGPVTLKLSGPGPELVAVNEALRYRPKAYFRSDAFQLWKNSKGKVGWDGYIRPLAFMRGSGSTLATTKRGWLSDILAKADTLGYAVDKTRLLPNPYSGLALADVGDDLVEANFRLDDNQRTGIWLWLTHAMGVNQAFVSSGKTAMFCGAAAFIKRGFPKARFLYLVPTERLVRQVASEAAKFLPGFDVGQYGGGKHDHEAQDMVVATAAVVGCHFDEHVESGWFKTFTGLLCDESHRVTGPTMQKIVDRVPAYFRLGASDTTREADIEAYSIIKASLGPVLHRVEGAPLMAIGRVAKPQIYIVDVPAWTDTCAHLKNTAEPGSTAWVLDEGRWIKATYEGSSPLLDGDGEPVFETVTRPVMKNGKRVYKNGVALKAKTRVPVSNAGWHMLTGEDGTPYEMQSRWCLLDRVEDKAIVLNRDRNNLIAEWAEYFSKQDKQVLVVCTRTLHVLLIEHLIKTRIDPNKVRILFSAHTSRERDTVFDWLRLTPGAVLISPLVKEGVSINEIKAGIIADHIVSPELARQIIGRYIRKKPGENVAEIIWFMDRQHPRLRRNTAKLLTELEKIRGFTYYHPCHHPADLADAQRFAAVDI